MRGLVAALACLVALAVAQPNWGNFFTDLRDQLNNKLDDTVDYIHEYRFEYHDPRNGEHLLIAISDTTNPTQCKVIEPDASWEPLLQNNDKIHLITEELYKMIHSGSAPERELTSMEFRQLYGDNDASRECARHKISVVTYTPSQAILGTSSS